AKGDQPPPGAFAGLIHDRSVAKLVKPTDLRVNNCTFALSAFSDATAFRAFTDAAGLKEPPLEVDWDHQAVVVAGLKEHTHRLLFKQWTTKGTIGELVCYWDGIEPHYGDRFPALLYRFDRSGLKRVVVKCDFDYLKLSAEVAERVLGEIPHP